MTSFVVANGNDETIISARSTMPGLIALMGRQFILRDILQMSNGQIQNILIIPNANRKTFLGVTLETSAGIDLELYEGTQATGGAVLEQLNPNRENILTSGIAVTTDPAITDDGDLLVLTSTLDKKDIFSGDTTFIMDRTKNYLIRVTSQDNVNNVEIRLAFNIYDEL